jgi:hypothetical protein
MLINFNSQLAFAPVVLADFMLGGEVAGTP